MSILMLKLLLAPALVTASSWAGRRWGASLTGTLVALPIVAGPILFISWLEHGPVFAARAASASLLGLISMALFAVAFALLSRAPRTGHWSVTLLLAWLVCLLADWVVSRFSVSPVVALCLSAGATAAATKILARIERGTGAGGSSPASPPPWWDLPARAVSTAVLVTVVTTAAASLGPTLTGVLAPFPIATSVVAAFALAQGGAEVATATLSGVLRGLWGFAAFCFVVAVLTEPVGGPQAFGIAAACTLALQLTLRIKATTTTQRAIAARSD